MTLFSLLYSLVLLFLLSEQHSLSFIFLLTLVFVFACVESYLLVSRCSLAASLVFFLLLIIVFFLSTYSLLVFFILYELRLFPVSLLILLLGYQPEKVNSMLYLILYTVVCSAPFLYFSVVRSSSLNTGFSSLTPFSSLFVCTSFLVKSPMYTLHS